VVVLAGPNGAGKTTASTSLLQGELSVSQFVNADQIARGLSGFAPDRVAMQAGRIMLARLDELARDRANFAFETTLASRSFAPRIADLVRSGYEFHLFFIWLPNADAAIARVAARVRAGGHDIPADDIRRRYAHGIENLFSLYPRIATRWTILHGSAAIPTRIASGGQGRTTEVIDSKTWAELGHVDDPT